MENAENDSVAPIAVEEEAETIPATPEAPPLPPAEMLLVVVAAKSSSAKIISSCPAIAPDLR